MVAYDLLARWVFLASSVALCFGSAFYRSVVVFEWEVDAVGEFWESGMDEAGDFSLDRLEAGLGEANALRASEVVRGDDEVDMGAVGIEVRLGECEGVWGALLQVESGDSFSDLGGYEMSVV